MQKLIVVTFLVFVSITIGARKHYNPILWNMERLEQIRINPSYQIIIKINRKKADYYVKSAPVAVTDKVQCISGNKHNYESLSSYYWPDENNPKGAYIQHDGKLNPEVSLYDRVKIDTCALRLRLLAQVYYWTGEEVYYNAFRRQLRCWFINPSTKMLPNLNYGQVIKGKDNNKGQPHGIIDIFPLVEILESVRLVDKVHGIDYFTVKKMRSWARDMLQWLRTSRLGTNESKQPNNHSTAYDVLCLALASFCGNECVSDTIISEYAEKRLYTQINEQGVLIGETWRTRSYMYSIQNLSHIVDFCIMTQNLKMPILESNFEIINRCATYLSSFIENQNAYPYKEIGNWSTLEEELKIEIDRLNRLMTASRLSNNRSPYKVNYFNASAKYSK